jgi:hypothetical protein
MKNLFLFCVMLIVFKTVAQNNHVYVNIIPHVESNTFISGEILSDLNGISFDIDYFNYYLSNLHLIHDGGQDLDLSDTVFLVKMEDHLLDLGMQNVQSIEAIQFSIGVPDDLNHLDISTYHMEHPLGAQSPSMHWGWSAGYAFMIIGGSGDNTSDEILDVIYEIHCLGDDNFKNVSVNTTATQTSNEQLDVTLFCNVDQWIAGADPGNVGSVHSLNGIVTTVMNNVNDRDVFVSPENAEIQTLTKTEGNLIVVNRPNEVEVNWSEIENGKFFNLVDVQGRVINTDLIQNKIGAIQFTDLSKGTYQFMVLNENGEQLNSVRFIF